MFDLRRYRQSRIVGAMLCLTLAALFFGAEFCHGAGPQIFMAAAKKGAAPPAAPTQNAAGNSPAQVTADWVDVTGETSYTLRYSTSSALDAATYNGSSAYPETVAYPALPTSATAGKITGIPSGSTTYTINGPLTQGTTYYTRISAIGPGGESALSGTQSAAAAAALISFEASLGGWTLGTDTGALGEQGVASNDTAASHSITAYQGSYVIYLQSANGCYDEDCIESGPINAYMSKSITGPTTLTFYYRGAAVDVSTGDRSVAPPTLLHTCSSSGSWTSCSTSIASGTSVINIDNGAAGDAEAFIDWSNY